MTTTASRNCTNCGASASAEHRYCPACGFNLPPYQPPPPEPPPPEPPPRSSLIRGEARNVQLRSRTGPSSGKYTPGTKDILTFRVDRFDETGNSLQPIPVEMTGEIKGVLNEGDKIEIDAKWQPGQTLEPKKLLNRTTGGVVQIKGP